MVNKIEINNSIIEIMVGGFIEKEYDAIVIPSNSRLLPSGILRCYVLRNAGAKVQIQCNRIINKLATIPVGKAVMTTGGDLKAKYIIHVVPPTLGMGHEGKKLMMGTVNSLKLADEAGLNTIIFPPLSKEMLGFTPKLIAKVMLPAIKKYLLEQNKNLLNVLISLDSLPEYKEFENILDQQI